MVNQDHESWFGVPGCIWTPALEEQLNPSRHPTPAQRAEQSGRRGAKEDDEVPPVTDLSDEELLKEFKQGGEFHPGKSVDPSLLELELDDGNF